MTRFAELAYAAVRKPDHIIHRKLDPRIDLRKHHIKNSRRHTDRRARYAEHRNVSDICDECHIARLRRNSVCQNAIRSQSPDR